MKTYRLVPKSYIVKTVQDVYGTPLLSAARQLEHIRVKGALTEGQLTCLLNSRDHGILPKCFQLKLTQNTDHNSKKILFSAGMSLLTSEEDTDQLGTTSSLHGHAGFP
ncbi:hypothetical protein M513_09255 [Trichuris suis]|uniref:Uncharacterized protein n=1 Tax=Trichuris suis TaxID=68888 RepID=A0A085LXU2_9BILA|nr:hypothetical protein M513_09255 [Trichuris suis]